MPGLQRSSASISAETELAPLSRAGKEGSDWNASIRSDVLAVEGSAETGLVTSLGLVEGVVAKASIESTLEDLVVGMVSARGRGSSRSHSSSIGEGGQEKLMCSEWGRSHLRMQSSSE